MQTLQPAAAITSHTGPMDTVSPVTGSSDDDISVRQVGDDHFAVSVEGVPVGRSDFRDRSGVRVFTHTVVDPAYGGRGLASILIRAALDGPARTGCWCARCARSCAPSSSGTRTTPTCWPSRSSSERSGAVRRRRG